ncbi:MAG: hypothetical protein QXX56_05140 [Candidatus Bathyarchaeia archaeon]
MSGELRRRLESLEREIAGLRGELDRLETEMRSLAEERNILVGKIRELRLEAAKFRGERDSLNDEVKSLKAVLAELKQEYAEKIGSLRELRQRIRDYLKLKPARDEGSLEREIAELDWRIQTTTMSLEEEKRVVERIKSLEGQLSFYRRLKSMRDEASRLEVSFEKVRGEIAVYRDKIAEAAAESQKFHEKMIERLKMAGELKNKLAEVDRRYMENKNKILALRLQYRELLSQVSAIRKTIREEEERRKTEVVSALKERVKREALEKIKRGEKISFEEFKILAEEGII